MKKEQFIELLESTGREGIDKLIAWLDKEGFFASPASTKYHGCYEGGLMNHSVGVYELLINLSVNPLKLDQTTSPGQDPFKLEPANLIIAALLHDVCKVGAYIGTEKPYKWNRQQPKGHATLSIQRISQFIKLDEIEELMIRYHMGVYGLNEFYEKGSWQYKSSAEYPLRGDHSKDDSMTKEESQAARYGQSLANAWFHNPICKVLYFCDELETLGEKAKN